MKKHINSLIFNTFSLLQEQPLKILFVFFDAGETKALEPVMQAFERSNISFQILAVGTSTKLLKGHTNAIFIDECDRDRSLDPKIIKELTVPDVVITGTVSEMQRQISQELKIKGAKILAYHDNFSPIKSTDFIAPFFTLANLILVPSENVAKSIHQIDSNIKIEIVGQPTLEHWIEQTEKIDFNKLRNLINLEESKPFLLYIAGYGKGYADYS